jgi:Ca2+-binding RTX toxin-like protein
MVVDDFSGPSAGTLTGYSVSTGGVLNFEYEGLEKDLVQAILNFEYSPEYLPQYLLDGNDTITGSALSEYWEGYNGHDVIYAGAGDDTLAGIDGDELHGGLGDDVYLVNFDGQPVVELDGEGIDTAVTYQNYTLPAFVEDLVPAYPESLGGLTLVGNSLANVILGPAGGDVIDGGDGDDTLFGGANDGRDTIDGGAGADSMAGSDGDDVYYVDNAGDVVDDTGGDQDLVRSAVLNYTMPAEIESVELLPGAISATGNASNNSLVGNDSGNALSGGAGNDTLDGGEGPDTLAGGTGDDTYLHVGADDVVAEAAGAGIDTIRTEGSFTLPANFEDLFLEPPGVIEDHMPTSVLRGNSEPNRIEAESGGPHLLDGGAGADTMLGGFGSDTYVVDNIGDVVSDDGEFRIDTVETSVQFSLVDHPGIENLTLTGAVNFDVIGNANANRITGNASANHLTGQDGDTLIGGAGNDVLTALGPCTLDGGAGADTMFGSARGRDLYIVDNVADVVVEPDSDESRSDEVDTWVSLEVGSQIEVVLVLGDADVDVVAPRALVKGNAGDNRLEGGTWIYGSDGDDTLVGSAVFETNMWGGMGDDVYVVNKWTYGWPAPVLEHVDGGVDTLVTHVFQGATFVPPNFENVHAFASTSIWGTDGPNELYAGPGANMLVGAAGDDLLHGMAGNDTLNGGDGNDTLYGDGGVDTATFPGPSTDYTIARVAGGAVEVSSGGDVDVLVGISSIAFADIVMTLDAHPVTGTVSLTGTPVSGQSLSSNVTGLADADKLGATSLQWFRDEMPISNATGASYLVTDDDKDAALSLRVSFIDGAGNWEGLWSASLVIDATAPKLVGYQPAFGQQDVPPDSMIRLDFDEPVVRGSGLITLTNVYGTVLAVFDAATSPGLSISGTHLTIDPPSPLPAGSTIFVGYASGSVTDLLGNPLFGENLYRFSTPDHVVQGPAGGAFLAGLAQANDLLFGSDGDDTLSGLSGDDTLVGGAGIDTAVLSFDHDAVQRYITDIGSYQIITPMGTVHAEVERADFDDALLAYDTWPGDDTWQAEALLWAALDTSPWTSILSKWVAVADDLHDVHAVAQAMLDFYAPGLATADLVRYLFNSVVHESATQGEVDYVSSLVGPGQVFERNGDLLAFVATDPMNTWRMMNSDFIGSEVQLDPSFF